MARRSWTTKLSLLLMMAVILSLIIQVSIQHVSTQADSPEVTGINLPPVVSAKHSNPKMDSALSQLVEAAGQGKAAHFAQQHGLYIESNKVRVILESKPDKIQDAILAAQAVGGNLETSYRNLIQVRVPITALNDIAKSPYIDFVQSPLTPTITETTIESMGLINATAWNGAGYDGTGISIGVLDMGFKNYSTLLGTDLPSSIADTWWSPTIGYNESEHGTACAEVIHDIAPNASLYFATCNTSVEWGNAIDWFISKDVDIISCSLIWLNGGPGDGTGTICDAVSDAADNGILWVNSAGNYAEGHWMGEWSDPDSSRMHNFSVNDESNAINVDLDLSSTIRLGLRWNDSWDTSSNDYDLILYNSSLSIVASSERPQDGSSWPPIEEISYTATYSGTYHIGIYNYSADGTSELHLFSFNQDLQYQNPEYSILQPADSPDAMTVGAVRWSTPNAIESWSSQGPTMDNRIKPDIVAPDCINTASYGAGGFCGTSAAAPHVAGAAALVKQMYPLYTYTDLQSHLEFSAVELGDAGKDNVFGSGRLYLDETPPNPDTTIDPILDCVKELSAISGSASCEYGTISNVDLQINRSDDSYFWNGSDWQEGEIWIDTTPVDGTFDEASELWRINSASLPVWTTGNIYYIAARAIDNESNYDLTPALESFTIGDIGWETMEIDIGDDLIGIWGNSSSDIFVIGGNNDNTNVFAHYDGTEWDVTGNTSGYSLRDIWGSSSSDIFAVGTLGTILHYNGSSWSSMESNTLDDLWSVWGDSSTDVYAVGANGTILNYDGFSWTNMTSTTNDTLQCIWGSNSSNIYAVGYTSTSKGTILHYNGSWNHMSIGDVPPLAGVWGFDPSDIFAAGYAGTLLHYNGASWSSMNSGTANTLGPLWCITGSNVFTGGVGGTIIYYRDLNWIPSYSGTTNTINAIWGNVRDVYAVGDKGTILHYNAYPDRSVYLSGPQSVTVGQSFNMTVGISRIPDLYTGRFSMEYDPDIIRIVAPNVGNGLLYGNATTYEVLTAGNWSLNGSGPDNQGIIEITFNLSNCTNPIGVTEGKLANICFTANSSGTTNISFVPLLTLTDYYDEDIPMNWYNKSITVYDVIPPPIADLNCSTIAGNYSALHLTWTATGIGGGEYDIRYRLNSPVTEENWGYSTTVRCIGEPTPQASPASESFNVTGLDHNTKYYFSIKVANPNSMFSDISNTTSCTTAPWLHSLNISIVPPEGGSAEGAGEEYLHGNVYDISAIPSNCYHFVNWSGDTDTIANTSAASTTITMNDDYSITANFAIDTFTLTYNAGAGGSISGDSPQTVDCGEDGSQVTAVPDEYYHFVDWSDGVLTASRTDTNVQDNITVIANFAIDTFTLTYNAGAGGSIIGINPQTVTVGEDGSQVTATPNACYHFVDWSDGVLTASRTDTNAQDNITVTANFVSGEPFYLDISVNGNGSVTGPGEGTFGPYNCDNTIDLLAEPELGYEFVSWSGDISAIANPYSASTTITMYDDYSITANFGLPATGFYGNADQDGMLSIGDYSSLRLMLFNKQSFNPGGDADQDGTLSIGDYSHLRLMLFNKQPIVDKYEVSYDFLSGASSNKWAKSKTVSSVPPADNYDNESGWTDAIIPNDYDDIALTDSDVWTITGSPGLYSALQCKFTVVNNPADITSIGITLNGSSSIAGSTLRFYAWNFDTESWTQIGSDFSMTTSIASYSSWAAWGKVYADYIDGSQYMYILAILNTANANINVDYLKLTVAHP
ncbi:MAG: S8 family serine peptidase [Dehalococcoidia bacterium]